MIHLPKFSSVVGTQKSYGFKLSAFKLYLHVHNYKGLLCISLQSLVRNNTKKLWLVPVFQLLVLSPQTSPHPIWAPQSLVTLEWSTYQELIKFVCIPLLWRVYLPAEDWDMVRFTDTSRWSGTESKLAHTLNVIPSSTISLGVDRLIIAPEFRRKQITLLSLLYHITL